MNPRDLALVGIRIVAVLVATQLAGSLPLFGQTLLSAASFDFADLVVVLSFFVFPVVAAWVLWIFAPDIAKLATAECVETDTDRSSLGQDEVVASGLVIIGVYLFVTTVPRMLRRVSVFLDHETTDPWSYFAADALICLFAVALIFGAKAITNSIIKLRHAGH